MKYGDARFRPGTYITDGKGLFEVVSVCVTHEAAGASNRVYVEDCKTLEAREYTADAIRREFRVVRSARSRPNTMSKAA
jgi:hypothetical protein